ncbi:ImmA/IrrE family metallo-endopeptidase [Enterococcus gallinarum]|uniref:ImmA/IrrE family metallo-endopeptidase n=1 Tax=Enterococcus gallinarum TaxID=1353 RepID=UPI00209164B3|nr:ImmA/IrrE family metallo-endopeptidase [Enterococcus gallinarum]MCO5478510.1 ImmA/IrrE family metallo-endopeptidase [Enterococcus gallinarum]
MDLDSEVNEIIDELGVTIKETPRLDSDAKYIAIMNTIVLDARLSDRVKLLRLLHELGHVAKHKNNYVLYKRTFALHSKMENEAEEFMIEKMLEVTINNPEFDPDSFNYVNFLESYEIELRYEPFVKQFMAKYLVGANSDSIFF